MVALADNGLQRGGRLLVCPRFFGQLVGKPRITVNGVRNSWVIFVKNLLRTVSMWRMIFCVLDFYAHDI